MAESSPGRRWYRSLYWRIALGLVVTIAGILAVQGLVVLWLLGREVPPLGPRRRASPAWSRRTWVARLEATPGLDLGRFVREEYQQRLFPFVVVLRDGRVVSPDGLTVPDELREATLPVTPSCRPGPPRRGGRGGRGGRGLGRQEPPLGGLPPAVIRVDGQPVGVVFVMPQTLVRRRGPRCSSPAAPP